MVLGLARPRLRSDGSGLFSLRRLPMTLQPPLNWAEERASVLFQASADIVGGFPGYADRGCLLDGATIRITERFLLVDDGLPRGFAIPLGWIEGTTQVAQPGRDDQALRIFYRMDGTPRLFTIRFRANRIGARGQRRSVRAQEVLHAAGILDRFAATPPLRPDFTLPWDQTREFEGENVIWTGRASAPVVVGGELAPSEIWLTTKSLIWGSGEGEGINRIPLPLFMDLVSTRLRDWLGTPVIYLAIGDETTGRYELPFTFSLHTPPDRNFRERGAFLVGLRSRGIADGHSAPYHRPWLSNPLAPDPEPTVDDTASFDTSDFDLPEEPVAPGISLVETPTVPPLHVEPDWIAPDVDDSVQPAIGGEPVRRRGGIAARIRRVPPTAIAMEPEEPAPDHVLDASEVVAPEPAKMPEPRTDTADILAEAIAAAPAPDDREDPTERFTIVSPPNHVPVEDVVLAEWSAPAAAEPLPDDRPIAETWADAAIAPPVERAPTPAIAITVEPWSAVRHYEEIAVGALAEALRVIDDCVAGNCGAPLAEHAPSSWDQARALAELRSLVERGEITDDVARLRKERLLALGETCVRLRTLIELHDHGYLSVDDLDRKRGALVDALSDTLARATSHRGPASEVA